MDKQLMSLFVVLAVVCLTTLHAAPPKPQTASLSRPKYIGCQASNECGLGNCCVIGMGRFSIPMCQSVQETHGSCKPFDHRPFNTTVRYPDGAAVSLTNVYRMFCPCAPSLACDWETSTCQDQDNYIYNTILV